MKKQLLIATALFIGVSGYSQTVGDTFVDNFITYEIISLVPNTIEVSDYDHSGSTDIVIPDTVTNSGTTYNVTSIGNDAFNYNGPTGKITSVNFTLPSNVTYIGIQAFRAQDLTTVIIPSSVISINEYAFWSNDLTSVTIQNGVESIGGNAFSANQITDIVIPNSVINIGLAAFQGNQITSVTLSNSLTSIEGSVFLSNQIQSIVIPNNITSISGAAFGNNQLTSLTLSNNLTFIGAGAFRNNNLTSVTIPSTVTDIENSVFRDNFNLATVISQAISPPTIFVPGINDTFYNRAAVDLTIPSGTSAAYASGGWTGFNSVTEALPAQVGDTFIDNFITYEITSLTPDTVEAIDYDMAGGTAVDIPATVPNNITTYTVTSIGQAAFFNKQLASINIGTNVTNIGFGAFQSNQLSSVTIPDNVTTLSNQVFSGNVLTNISIGSGITSIPDLTFNSNQLTNIVLPETIDSIGWRAFDGNSGLSSVTSYNTIPPIIITGGVNDSFDIDRSGIDLIIPIGTTGAYVTNPGALWTGFNSVTESTLSISDFELANNIKVITTSDDIRIIASNSVQLQNYTIYSISGSEVAKGFQSEISTSFLAGGMYILKLDFDKGTVIKKVMIH